MPETGFDTIKSSEPRKSLEELLNEAKEKGSPDLYEMSDEERSAIFDWYRSGDISPKDRVDFLEEFIRYGLVDDHEAFDFIKRMDDEQKRQIGEYLSRAVAPGTYLQSFYECWPALSIENRREIVEDFAFKRPEYAIMVAPFRNLDEVSTGQVKDVYGEIRVKSVLETEFSSIDKAGELLDSLIEYYEAHPEMHGFVDQSSWEARVRMYDRSSRKPNFSASRFGSSYARNIESVVKYYLKERIVVLYPYLEKLCDLGFITIEQAEELFGSKIGEKGYSLIDLESKEEEGRVKKLTKKIKGSDKEGFFAGDLSGATPQKHAFEIERIRDDVLARSADNILRKFKEHRVRFKFDHNKFLIDLIDSGIPVFSKVDLLGLNKEDVKKLILRFESEIGGLPFVLRGYGDMRTFLEWNRAGAVEGGVDLEKILTKTISKNINEGYVFGAGRLGEILSWYGQENRERIVKVINQRVPQLWLLNLRYIIENGVMPLDELLEKSSQQDPYEYLKNLNKIFYHISIFKKEKTEVPVEVEEVKETAKRIIIENPHLFFSEDLKNVVDQIFTKEQKNNFIEEQFKKQPVSRDFFFSLIRSEYLDDYLEECREVYISNPQLFGENANFTRFNYINRILSTKDIVELLIKNIATLNFNDILFGTELVAKVLNSPVHFEWLLSSLEEAGNFKGIVFIAKELKSIESEPDSKGNKFLIERVNRNLKKLKDLQSSARPAEAKELQIKIDRMGADLVKLEGAELEKGYTPQVKKEAARYKNKLKEKIKKHCRQDRFFVFNKDVFVLLEEDADEFLIEGIEDHSAINPDDLLWKYPIGSEKRNRLVFQELLGEEEFSKLFRLRIYALAFLSRKNQYYLDRIGLPVELIDEVRRANPALDVLSKDRLDKDFYKTVIEKISDYEFYSLYAPKIEKIADEEIALRGPRLETVQYGLRPEFLAMAKTVSVLENSSLALANKGAILNLNPREQKEVVEMLEFVTVHHLDTYLQIDLNNESFAEVKQKLVGRVLEFSKKSFGMEDVDLSATELMDVETVNALSIYYHNSCQDVSSMEGAFKNIIASIFNSDYKSWRAWGASSQEALEPEQALSDLKESNLVPNGLSLGRYKEWVDEERVNFSDTFAYEFADVKSGIKDVLSLAVVDGHIVREDIDVDDLSLIARYQELIKPFKELTRRQKAYKEKIKLAKREEGSALSDQERQDYKAIKAQIIKYRAENNLELKNIEALRYIGGLKKLSLEELENESLFMDGNKISFTNAFKTLEEAFSDKPEFLSDLRRIRDILHEGNKQIFKGERVSKSELTITDRVDLKTHVLIGERPVDSCQHYDGSSLNYGLLSFIADPSVKIGQIWDENGNIIARAIFRLMEDEDGKPQIFMERVYSVNIHPKIKEAMIKFGAEKAKAMGVGLFTQEEGFEDLNSKSLSGKEKITLYSRGSRVPYVYTDAGGGRVRDGKFSIEIYA